MRKRSTKNIICLESWDGIYTEPKATMRTMLKFISELHGTKYGYNFFHTPDEMQYLLKNIPTRTFSLLYLSLHGKPETINTGLHSEFEIPLEKLSKWMGRRFEGFGLHLASCAVLSSSEKSIKKFMDKTGILFLTGFTKYVDFAESALVDMAFINRWMYAKNYKIMFDKMKQDYRPILIQNGFKYYLQERK